MGSPLLEVNDLRIAFPVEGRMTEAVRGTSFSLDQGEVVGLLGESGSGKSVSALAIMGLIAPPGAITAGTIWFNGRDLRTLNEAALRKVRGREISIVFQDPQTTFNPSLTIGSQLLHVIRTHTSRTKAEAKKRALEVLELVGLPHPSRVMRCYPHQLSGGMRQRTSIGMALACEPTLLIADEPTTALDVTIQAQMVELFRQLQDELNVTTLYITHNLDLMAELCDRAIVMYGGMIVEAGTVQDLFENPRHPYTRMLTDCVPRLDVEECELTVIPGMPPALGSIKGGCPFEPRCPLAFEKCRQTCPAEEAIGGHRFSCWEGER
ncbi:MAG: ABC transporter ATP-binding protein [Deltaproteobacteria bacterium]|jgi:oligopeptide/dipeptide ABC transporter ATP-binding protein|nr:ABC transporter ATP-binding protein [Deltaproteobacteria bacterium]MBT4640855.1 ABC transporter ATP-binding protein [Deltaproteobacteria bacterium]MBT6502376.1 ABC transporter ATP-binding protein [Deltaproteobacteria bacterium]MBT7155875.1 ABC transporter ATP-binding protein [Deltaproteobacteria bacterium]MBT7711665.1 ABC transporter ATP-binding protein [Deltaproteobacteria bacterium]